MPKSIFERTLNILTLVTCVVVLAVAVRYFRTGNTVTAPAAPSAQQTQVEPGDHIWLPGPAKGKPSLVVLLSPTCKYCAASIPFYRELASRDDIRTGRIALVFASQAPEQDVRQYLERNALPISEFVNGTAAGIRTTLTPTVIVVNTDGAVRSAWSGQLTSEGERVLRQVLDEMGTAG